VSDPVTIQDESEDTKPALLKYYALRVVSNVVVPNLTRINQENERKKHKSR
jgi:hypothetical protein